MRERNQVKLEAAAGYACDPVISYVNGYLWIGNDAAGDRRCYAVLSERKAIQLAKAILRRNERKEG